MLLEKVTFARFRIKKSSFSKVTERPYKISYASGKDDFCTVQHKKSSFSKVNKCPYRVS